VRNGADITHAGMRSGFESTSGFRDAFARLFGAPPGQARAPTSNDRAPGTQTVVAALTARWLDTPLGPMLAIADDPGLCLLEFVDRRMLETQLRRVRRIFGCPIVPGDNVHLTRIAEELGRYFEGDLRRFTVPLSMRGSAFQMRVWKRLMAIPYGRTQSYAQMARDIGARNAQRAVGRANGDNRMAIIIPCHRVIRSDGTLCGYGGGLWRKKWLLEHEQRHADDSA
jgi:AraC family transcriptional regulator of adaptative response/methylated-DNA-[protein]-cysteine methyltransferase